MSIKSDYGKTARTRVLTRIIVYLSEIKYRATCTELTTNVGGNLTEVKDGLNWLINNRIILKCRNYSGSITYMINPAWDELKNGK